MLARATSIHHAEQIAGGFQYQFIQPCTIFGGMTSRPEYPRNRRMLGYRWADATGENRSSDRHVQPTHLETVASEPHALVARCAHFELAANTLQTSP